MAYLQPHANKGEQREGFLFHVVLSYCQWSNTKAVKILGHHIWNHTGQTGNRQFSDHRKIKIGKKHPKPEKEQQLQEEMAMETAFKFKTVFARCNKTVRMMNGFWLSLMYIHSQTPLKALFCWVLQFRAAFEVKTVSQMHFWCSRNPPPLTSTETGIDLNWVRASQSTPTRINEIELIRKKPASEL